MHNVVLTTSQWARLPSDPALKHLGAQREEELRTDFCKPLLDCGARFERYVDHDSGMNILKSLAKKKPFLTDLSQELRDNVPLAKTGAGQVINKDLIDAEEKYKKELEELRDDLRSTKESDQQSRDLLTKEVEGVTKKLQALEEAKVKLTLSKRDEARDMETGSLSSCGSKMPD